MGYLKMNVVDKNALAKKIELFTVKKAEEIATEVKDGVNSMSAEAKQRAPGDQGILRNEISVERIDKFHYRLVSGADYSPYLEFGTRTQVSVPPELSAFASQFKDGTAWSSLTAKEAIFNWCKRKGIDPKAWYAIYIHLMTVGVKPHPFFFPAINRIKPIVIDRIRKIIQR